MHKSNHLDELMVDIRFWIKKQATESISIYATLTVQLISPRFQIMLLTLYSLLLPNVIYV